MKGKSVNFVNKNLLFLSILLILFIGITFAYVVAQLSDGAQENIKITSDTTDQFKLMVDKDINLTPTQFNLVEGGQNISDSANGTASLVANSTNRTAKYSYNVDFSITSNNFIYTTMDNEPEVLLTIIKPDGKEVTSINGLNYVTIVDHNGHLVNGFDITTATGTFEIAKSYSISSNSIAEATIQNWNFMVTFVNLDSNQSDNGGKGLTAEIIMKNN